MAKAVRWTPKAIATYIDVLSYLREKWTAREEQRFVDEVEDTIRYIVMFPKGFRSTGHARLREAPVKPYNILLYRIVMNHQEEVIPWSRVNQAVISGKRANYFLMDTSWLLHNQTYSIQFKVEELGTSRILPFDTTFKVLRPF